MKSIYKRKIRLFDWFFNLITENTTRIQKIWNISFWTPWYLKWSHIYFTHYKRCVFQNLNLIHLHSMLCLMIVNICEFKWNEIYYVDSCYLIHTRKKKLLVNVPEKMAKQRRIPVKGVMLLFNCPVGLK